MFATKTKSAARRHYEKRREIPAHVLRRWVIGADLVIVALIVAGVAGWL